MPRYGRLGDVIRRPRLTGLQRERVRHHDRVELHSVLEIFRQQSAAVLQLRRSDDETVLPAQAESTLDIATMLEQLFIERLRAPTHKQANIVPGFVRRQSLNADPPWTRTPRHGEPIRRPCLLGAVPRVARVNEDVAIDEGAPAHAIRRDSDSGRRLASISSAVWRETAAWQRRIHAPDACADVGTRPAYGTRSSLVR